MIFLRYESFREYVKSYPITTCILFINIVLFLLMIFYGSSENTGTLIKFGALVNAPPYNDDAWRYISAIFLHIGVEHLLFNCFAILIFAPPLERLLGKLKYAALYVGSGGIGNVFSQLLHNEQHISAGASGSIYGVYAAFLYMALFRKNMLDRQSRQTVTIILVIGVVQSVMTPQVNLIAHIGGAVGGFVLFGLMFKKSMN